MLKLTNIVKKYNENQPNEVQALRGVDLTVEQGEMIAIMGPSGSGKSTLLNIIGCMDTLTSGSYEVDGQKVEELSQKKLAYLRNKKFGFVLQDFGLLTDRSVEENIMVPLLFSKESLKKSTKRIKPILESLGIADLAKRQANQLSGGQSQRVAIARALVNEPDIILADEPTGALDTHTSSEVVDIFKQLNKQGKTVIIVTHNPEVAKACHKTYIIKDGLISREEEL